MNREKKDRENNWHTKTYSNNKLKRKKQRKMLSREGGWKKKWGKKWDSNKTLKRKMNWLDKKKWRKRNSRMSLKIMPEKCNNNRLLRTGYSLITCNHPQICKMKNRNNLNKRTNSLNSMISKSNLNNLRGNNPLVISSITATTNHKLCHNSRTLPNTIKCSTN